jgi:hypothetical protein
VHSSVKLLERGIEACFAGEASPRSPEFTTPPEYVDQVIHSTIFRFLVHTVSTLPRDAHRALGLNQIVVVWPEHSPPTRNPPARVDRAIPAIPAVELHLAVTARASPSQPCPSSDLSRRR